MYKKIDRWLYKHWARWEKCRKGILNPTEVLLLDMMLALISWYVFLFWKAELAYILLACAHGMTLVTILSFKDPDKE